MILFVLTRAGFEDMRAIVEAGKAPVWVNKDVLSLAELSALRSAKIDISAFTHAVDPASPSEMEGALAVIARHHPRQRVWVEKYCEPEV